MLIYVVTPIEESKRQSMTRLVCNLIVSQGHVPVAPRLYFPQFTQGDCAPQEEAMMSVCDEAWAVGERDDGMMDEMETARRLYLNVRHFKDLPALAEALEALKNKDSNVKPAQETDNLEESLEKGDISYGDILEAFPFNNDMVVIEVSGQDILDALEWGARSVPDESGAFLQVSGLTYEIDAGRASACTPLIRCICIPQVNVLSL